MEALRFTAVLADERSGIAENRPTERLEEKGRAEAERCWTESRREERGSWDLCEEEAHEEDAQSAEASSFEDEAKRKEQSMSEHLDVEEMHVRERAAVEGLRGDRCAKGKSEERAGNEGRAAEEYLQDTTPRSGMRSRTRTPRSAEDRLGGTTSEKEQKSTEETWIGARSGGVPRRRVPWRRSLLRKKIASDSAAARPRQRKMSCQGGPRKGADRWRSHEGHVDELRCEGRVRRKAEIERSGGDEGCAEESLHHQGCEEKSQERCEVERSRGDRVARRRGRSMWSRGSRRTRSSRSQRSVRGSKRVGEDRDRLKVEKDEG